MASMIGMADQYPENLFKDDQNLFDHKFIKGILEGKLHIPDHLTGEEKAFAENVAKQYLQFSDEDLEKIKDAMKSKYSRRANFCYQDDLLFDYEVMKKHEFAKVDKEYNDSV